MIDTVIHNDCLTVLRGMADNSVDAIVSDPPAGIAFMGKDWDTFSPDYIAQKAEQEKKRKSLGPQEHNGKAKKRSSSAYGSPAHYAGSYDFSLKGRDAFIKFMTDVMTEALRVLKPGGHALIWALPRTSHWTATALEDAGFEVRDKLYHLFGSGFPKSTAIDKQIDKMLGKEREVIGPGQWAGRGRSNNLPVVGYSDENNKRLGPSSESMETKPATPEAQRWQGYGTALKPSVEEWIHVQKPLTTVPQDEIIARTNNLLEALLWLLSPAKFVQLSSRLNPLMPVEGGFVRWIASVLNMLKSLELSDLMDTFSSQEAASTYLNIAWLWNDISGALYPNTNTFTTSTKTSLITELRTLNSWLSAIIPEDIIQVVHRQNGLWQYVGTADNHSSETLTSWQHIPKPSVNMNAMLPIMRLSVNTLANCAEVLSLPIRTSVDASAQNDVPTATTSTAKPNTEEWILCRKPLAESSIAAQVLATGTGGLNIGLTRVGSESTIRRNHTSGIWDSSQQENVHGSPQGRFPSHLLLSHSLWCVPRGTKRVKNPSGENGAKRTKETGNTYSTGNMRAGITYRDADGYEHVEAYDCAPDCPIAELDRQSGVRKSNARPNCYGKEYESNAIRTHGKYGATQYHAHDDQGGASRYFTNFPPDGSFEHSHEGIEDPFTCYYDGFHYVTCPFEAAPFPPDDYTPFLYQSKASRAERNRGCEDLPQLPSYTEDTPTPQRDKRQQVYQSNTHPTVKPLALMRWLIRLITPPDGIVLDPFCGSGSTCVAAIQEGKHFIGIEQDESYVNIANARIEYARTHEPDVVQVATKKVKSTTHSVGKHPKSYQANKGFNRNGSGQVPFDHLDQDGMEEVEDWDCVPDCPVRILGEQSGERKSGGRTKHIGEVTKNNHIYHAHTVASEFEMEASTGTAARYFQQFAPDLWTQDMQDAEEVFIAEGGYEGEVSA